MQNIQHALTLGAVDFIGKPCDVKTAAGTLTTSANDAQCRGECGAKIRATDLR